MNIQITTRHAKVSKDSQEYLKEELVHLEKYYDKMTSCHVILDTEHINKTVDISITAQGKVINAKGKSDNLGKSVDMALQKAIRQLKKLNDKIKTHKSTKELKEYNTEEEEDY